MRYDDFVRIVLQQLERHGPFNAVHRLECHWTDRDALIVRLERDYFYTPREQAGIVNHDAFELQYVHVVESRTVPRGWVVMRSVGGKALGVAELGTSVILGGWAAEVFDSKRLRIR